MDRTLEVLQSQTAQNSIAWNTLQQIRNAIAAGGDLQQEAAMLRALAHRLPKHLSKRATKIAAEMEKGS